MNEKQSCDIYLNRLLMIAVMIGFCGCAGTQVQNKESLLTTAGFRVRTPSTHDQWAMYNQMPPYKLERTTRNDKTVYTYADKQKGVVYIGGIKRMNATKNLESSSRSLKKSSRRPIAII